MNSKLLSECTVCKKNLTKKTICSVCEKTIELENLTKRYRERSLIEDQINLIASYTGQILTGSLNLHKNHPTSFKKLYHQFTFNSYIHGASIEFRSPKTLKEDFWKILFGKLITFNACIYWVNQDEVELVFSTLPITTLISEAKLRYQEKKTRIEIQERQKMHEERELLEKRRRIALSRRGRDTHCFACHRHLSSNHNTKCSICFWLICACGSCGCSYNGL